MHVKSLAAESMRTTLAARMQLVASQLKIEGTIRGLLRVYGLKIGAIHRNRFAARVLELLEQAALRGIVGGDRDRSCGCGNSCAGERKATGSHSGRLWPGARTQVAA